MAPPCEVNEPDAHPVDSSKTQPLRERALRDLEWAELLEGIARHCRTALGQSKVRGLRPLPSENAARQRWLLSLQVMELAHREILLPALLLPDVVHAVERLTRGSVASGPELYDVGLALRAVGELARFVAREGASAPALAAHLATDLSLRAVREELERCLEEGGTISDSASPELARARHRLGQLRQQIKARLSELIGRYREALQDAFIAERDGRYVLPVRADAPFRVHGIVLGSSASGATLYVEPREIADLGNRLKVAEAEVEQQEALVLGRLSESVASAGPSVLCGLDACAEADCLRAIELYARATHSRMLSWGAPGCVQLKEARHPLLALGDLAVVANDLVAWGGRGLVLSGPNAGGKTVALKCLGLAALAQACGLPVPAGEKSECGFFHEVLSDIGDDQSLARSLSSFSGHIETVRDITERAGPQVLVLLDEPAGGTDPEEGAALAVALLESLVERRAAVVVTTHYERLKEAASESERLENAAVGFDFDRLQPTFRLELGRPGASSALAVAERHGLSSAIVERAGELLPDMSRRRESLLLHLESKQRELEALRSEVEAEKARQAALRRELEREQHKRAERERAELAQAGSELQRTVREARAEVKRLVEGLSHQVSDRQELRQVQRAIDSAARLVAWGGEVQRKTGPNMQPSPVELKVGQIVRVRGMSTVAEVLELPKRGQLRVLAGAMKLTLRDDQVELVHPAPKAQARSRPSAHLDRPEHGAPKFVPPPRTEDVTLDLRGERVDTALDRLEAFVDLLLRRGESAGYVLHGHGTGALKSAVRQHLRELPLVLHERPAERDEGGDAWTVFWLGD